MTKLVWDQVGARVYETGVDHGVLYLQDAGGAYANAYAWNGLTTVTESPSGAEATPIYADNIKYLNLVSLEQFGCTIEAYTYPAEFGQCDGTYSPEPGVSVGQQSRKQFGLAYRTRVGNDVDGSDHGYKLHLVYGCLAAPSEKAYATINDSPEAISFSWDVTTTPVDVTGHKPTSLLTIDSTKVNATALTNLENELFGTNLVNGRLPLPDEVLALFAGTVTTVTATAPTYNSTTDIITIPAVTGVEYVIAGNVVPSGAFGPITADTLVTARATAGYVLAANSDNDWMITFA